MPGEEERGVGEGVKHEYKLKSKVRLFMSPSIHVTGTVSNIRVDESTNPPTEFFYVTWPEKIEERPRRFDRPEPAAAWYESKDLAKPWQD